MKKLKYLLFILPLLFPVLVHAAVTDVGYITNNTTLMISNNKGADYYLNHGVINNTGLTDINAIIINISNQNFLANTIYQVEIQTPNAKFNTNINSFRISGYNTTCRYYGMAELNTAYPKIYFSCPADTSYVVIGLNTIKENINITTASNFSWNYAYLRKLDDSSDMDFGPVIQNQTQNTNDIINNNDNNTQQIIDNQNSLLGSECPNLFDNSTLVAGDVTGAYSNIRISSRQSIYLQPGTYYFKTNLPSTYNYYLAVNSSSAPPMSNYPTYTFNTSWQTSNTRSFTLTTAGYFEIGIRAANNGNISLSDVKNYEYMLSKTNSTYCKYGTYTSKLDDVSGAIGDLNSALTDDSPISLNDISSTAGWLPAGPIDSIINLPLNFFNGLLTALNGTCSPLNVPLPFVNENLEIPCISTLLNQINGFSTFWNWFGGIASVLILYKYLIGLYKYYDNLTGMKETSIDYGGAP